MSKKQDCPHRRYNALTGDWILVSPHRTQRPWQGHREKDAASQRPPYDPQCYLCPGNLRADGGTNPNYAETFVFTNDYPALLPDSPAEPRRGGPLFSSQSVQGTCRVICFSPRHDLTLPRMAEEQIEVVVGLWAVETAELGSRYRWVQVFENKGAVMGCSKPASARADLGVRLSPQRAGERGPAAGVLLAGTCCAATGGLPGRRTPAG